LEDSERIESGICPTSHIVAEPEMGPGNGDGRIASPRPPPLEDERADALPGDVSYDPSVISAHDASTGDGTGLQATPSHGGDSHRHLREIWDAAIGAVVKGVDESLPSQVGNLLAGITMAMIVLLVAASLVFAHHILGIPWPTISKGSIPAEVFGGSGMLGLTAWAWNWKRRR
jgi:hypothetical protein